MVRHVVYSDTGDKVVCQRSGLSKPGDSLATARGGSDLVHPLIGPAPLIPGVAFLLVPGAKSLIKSVTFFRNVAIDVAAEAFPDVVVEGFKLLFGWQRLVGPGEGQVVAPVPSELLWADACPIRVGKLRNRDRLQPNADSVDLAEFVVTHPFLLSHLVEYLHEGLIICPPGQRGPCTLNFNVGIEIAEALSDV